MKKLFIIIVLLLSSSLAMATGCWQGNNPCRGPQGCCSSSAEWNHSGTNDNGTCRDLRDCESKWLWNGSSAHPAPPPPPVCHRKNCPSWIDQTNWKQRNQDSFNCNCPNP